MITLHYPSSLSQSFVNVEENFFPLVDISTTKMEVKTSRDFLTEGSSVFGENTVNHLKSDGDLYYDPVTLASVTPSPLPEMPDRVKLFINQFSTVYANRGVMQGDRATLITLSNLPYMRYLQGIKGNSTHITAVYITYDIRTPTRTQGDTRKVVYEEVARTSTSISYKTTTTYWNNYTGSTNWTSASASSCLAYDPPSGVFMVMSGTKTVTIRRPGAVASDSILSPTDSVSSLLSLVAPARAFLFEDKHKPKHYGTLAAEAIETMDYIHTNMISFVSELRDPSSLIPKLKSLSRLKTLKGVKDVSDYYLSGKYGVLPTISDLQEIVGAFKRVEPYLDKNGFSTYHAGYTDTIVDGNTTSTLEQRVKVALSNEERGLLLLTDTVEKFGFMPNLSNIWDLVPYSFALDWFIGVGDLLESVDSDLRIATLDIKYTTMSNKRTVSTVYTPTSVFPFKGTVDWVYYRRWTTVQCPRPPLSLQVTGTVSSHWLEASALLIQRAKF